MKLLFPGLKNVKVSLKVYTSPLIIIRSKLAGYEVALEAMDQFIEPLYYF